MDEEREVSTLRRIALFPLTRIVLTLALTALLAIVLVVIIGRRHLNPAVQETILALASVTGLLVIGRFIEKRPASALGFPRKKALSHLAMGFLIGAAMLAVVVGVMAIAGWYRIAGVPAHPFSAIGGETGTIGAFIGALVFFLLVAVFEETVSRGVIMRITEDGLGSWMAIAISSLMFGFGHLGNPNSSLLAAVAITIEAGVLLGAGYLLTRDLWLPIGLHWAWNLFEGPIFGTPVSGKDFSVLATTRIGGPSIMTGGRFGPEAGLIAMIVGAVTGLLLLWLAHRKGNILAPPWVMKKRVVPEGTRAGRGGYP
ncbi:MAG: lysostaphin resistance A-like protein [Actinomycetota bacterium]